METLTATQAKEVLAAYSNRKRKGNKTNVEALKKIISWGAKAVSKESFAISPDDCLVFQRPTGSRKEQYGRKDLLKRGYNAFRKHITEDLDLDATRVWMTSDENKFYADFAGLVKMNA